MKIMLNSIYRIAPDGTPHFAVSHQGLFCLPMSHKKDANDGLMFLKENL